MGYCLPEFAAEKLKTALTEGKVTPEKLGSLPDSAARRAMLDFLGKEHAQKVNALFESKLLLKNQQKGMVKWAEQVLGMKDPIYRDVLARVEKLDKVLTKKELDVFLEDMVQQRLGMKVTEKEMTKLVEMSKDIEVKKAELPKEMQEMPQHEYLKQETPAQMEARIEYGLSYVRFKRFAEGLHPNAAPLGFKDFNPLKPGHALSSTGALGKSIVASIDNSFWLNQGIPALFNPRTAPMWAKNFAKSFGDLAQGLKGKDPTEVVQAEIYSRPDAVNGLYAREKVAIGLRTEEAYPTSLPERIPALGRAFKASSGAYNAAALRIRADLIDYHNTLARKQGVDLTDKVNAEAIGHVANASSGRGSLGTGEAALQTWNNIMFSPRLLKGAFDTVTAHSFNKKVRASPFARKQAAKQLLSMTATYYSVMALIETLYPGTTEMDPRSSHFGQVKTDKDTYVNVIGPFRPLVRALSVALPTFRGDPTDIDNWGLWRETASGKWNFQPLYADKPPKFGQYTPLDALETFIEGKASPLAAIIRDHWKGQDFSGKPPTPLDDVMGLTVPMSIDSYIEDSTSENSEQQDNALRNAVISGFGGGVVTYD